MSKNLSELSGRKGLDDNLFDRYGQLTLESNTPSREDLAKLAEEFMVGEASVFGATTSYDFLKPENRDKKIYICNGTVCECAGTQGDLKSELLKFFTEDQIGEMCCLGRCHENSSFHYQGNNYSHKSPEEIRSLIETPEPAPDRYSVTASTTPLLTDENLADLPFDLWQKVLQQDPDSLLEEVRQSGIRGRGGAGFPMATKLEFCAKQANDTKFVICNADEGDPGAFTDRYLLERQPRLVIFGMLAAGYMVGANWGVLYIRAEYPESITALQKELETWQDKGLIGNNIQGSSFHFHFKIIEAKGAYICGEETALINSLEGQRPEVRIRPPYPAEEGLFNKPTLVNNVETLAAMFYMLQCGGRAYAQLGTERSKGTKLLSLDSHFHTPGVCEVEMGTPLQKVVEELGGGFTKPVKALHIGGPLGGLVPVSEIPHLNVSFESFKQAGFLLGHASVICIPEDYPLIRYLQHLFGFAADESCGKCFPCRLGTRRAEEMMGKAMDGSYQIDPLLFDDLLTTLEQGSLCAHGGGLPLPVRNALQYFKDELAPYFANND